MRGSERRHRITLAIAVLVDAVADLGPLAVTIHPSATPRKR
jgi:hypothetical protein